MEDSCSVGSPKVHSSVSFSLPFGYLYWCMLSSTPTRTVLGHTLARQDANKIFWTPSRRGTKNQWLTDPSIIHFSEVCLRKPCFSDQKQRAPPSSDIHGHWWFQIQALQIILPRFSLLEKSGRFKKTLIFGLPFLSTDHGRSHSCMKRARKIDASVHTAIYIPPKKRLWTNFCADRLAFDLNGEVVWGLSSSPLF